MRMLIPLVLLVLTAVLVPREQPAAQAAAITPDESSPTVEHTVGRAPEVPGPVSGLWELASGGAEETDTEDHLAATPGGWSLPGL